MSDQQNGRRSETVEYIGNGRAGSWIRGKNASIRAFEQLIPSIAAGRVRVLITGESGTGKSALAQFIHQTSPAPGMPFTELNCQSLNKLELYRRLSSGNGNGKTSALALQGTVLLKDIAELSPEGQDELLRVLKMRDLPQANVASPVHIIAATSANLEFEARAGRFREELYYRLSGVVLRIPPLRQRAEDIPMLAQHFLQQYANVLPYSQPKLSPELMQFLCEYKWPGNVRELAEAMKAHAAIGDERITIAILKSAALRESRGNDGRTQPLKTAAREASRHAERELILDALTRTRWNRKRAAQDLKISYKALLYKLKQMDLNAT